MNSPILAAPQHKARQLTHRQACYRAFARAYATLPEYARVPRRSMAWTIYIRPLEGTPILRAYGREMGWRER